MTKTNVGSDPKAIMAIYFDNEVLKKQFADKVHKSNLQNGEFEKDFPWLLDSIIVRFGNTQDTLSIQQIQLIHSISKM